jgi:UDP-MurNAc hydroxylase
MINSYLTFINHASFLVEDELQVTLIDPWIEGKAFFNGWALLDNSTSDDGLVEYLVKLNKDVNIWYSHEHSDHLSFSFLKKLKKTDLNVKILYQKTLDNRVGNFLKKIHFNFIEVIDGVSIKLSPFTNISSWKYKSGDSFCLIDSSGVRILNTNDCEIKNKNDLNFVKNKINSNKTIDILFAQFGYANFIGNEVNEDLRKLAAADKISDLKLKAKFFDPKLIIPFASFVYFCNEENFYLNDFQNSPSSIRKSNLLSDINRVIYFMKPYDKIAIGSVEKMINDLSVLTKSAENHWQNCIEQISPICGVENKYSIDELVECSVNYSKGINKHFLFLPRLLELIGVIRPMHILIVDLQLVVKLSYFDSDIIVCRDDRWDMSMSSEVFRFILTNDYGFNSTSVNGRFRLKIINKRLDIYRFFGPQDFKKNGYGIKSPIKSLIMLVGVLKILLSSRKNN